MTKIDLTQEELNYTMDAVIRLSKSTGKNIAKRICFKVNKQPNRRALRIACLEEIK